MGYFNVSKNSVISRLINNYLLSHKVTIFIALLMMIISAGATGLHAWLVQPALDEVLINKDEMKYAWEFEDMYVVVNPSVQTDISSLDNLFI